MARRRNSKLASKKVKPIYAFVVDGQCEYWYISMLKRNEPNLTVSLKPDLSQAKRSQSLEEQFDMVLEMADDYDKVFWIVDFDVINKETVEAKKGKQTPLQAMVVYEKKIALRSEIILIYNNPCVEFWYLLHFIETSKFYLDYKSLEKALLKYVPKYEKSEKFYTKNGNDIYLQLKPYLKQAIEHSRKTDTFSTTRPRKGCSQMSRLFDMVL